MKRSLYLILVLVALIILAVRGAALSYNLLFESEKKAGVKVLSVPEGAEIELNGAVVGRTPFETSDLIEGTFDIKIRSDGINWQGRVGIDGGTRAIINREFSKESSSSAGETLTLKQGQGVTIISGVVGAEVEIDGKVVGKTPVSVNIADGEHTFVLSHPGYLKRSIRALLPSDYNLIVNVDLALTEANLTDIVTPTTTSTEKVVVKNTPTGFLRVRDKASTTSREVGRVKPKDELVLLEEISGWVRVRLPDGKEGYVSEDYVEKINP
jgi:hypothetical protein